MLSNETGVNIEHTFTIASGGTYTYAGSEFVRVQSITSGKKLKIRTDRGDEFFLGISQRIRFRGELPRQLIFVNEEATSVTATLLLGSGEFDDPELSSTVNVDTVVVATPSGFSSTADVPVSAAGTSVVLATNANRVKAIISNPPTNVNTFRVGDSGVGAANGLPLAPGKTIEIDGTAEIRAYNPGPGGESLSPAEVTT